jgi:hypothetical protein
MYNEMTLITSLITYNLCLFERKWILPLRFIVVICSQVLMIARFAVH